MRKIKCLAVSLVVVVAAPWISLSQTSDAPLASDRIVVMISVDGLAADYFDDPKADMPTIRALAAEGARASSMRAVSPTVTWPNHTTLVTGVYPARHGVLGNNYYDRAAEKRVVLISDPVYDKDQIVKVPTIYDVAKRAGLKTAAIRWPASRRASTLDWTIPDIKSVDLLHQCSTPALFGECEAAGFSLGPEDKSKPATETEPMPTDKICVKVFNLILEKHRPNLALLHVVDVDHDEHLHGPRTEKAYEAIKVADDQVRQVWDVLKRDFPNKATLLVVSDHGFSEIKRTILPNVILRKAGLIETSGKKEISGPVRVVVQGGSAMIYIVDQSKRADIVKRVKKAFSGVDGVDKVISPNQLHSYGLADPKDDPHAPDMFLFAKEGNTFGDTASGDLPFQLKPERRGSHGHDPAIPHLHATFVAWGVGIKPGARVGEISNTSVAPTIAKLLHLSMPDVDGKPLKAILAE